MADVVGLLQQLDTDLQQVVAALNRLIVQTSLASIVPITSGGTGASNAVAARANLGIGTAGTKAASDPALAEVASYRTGDWTPGLRFGGGNFGMTALTAVGSYTQIGRQVFCQFSISIAAKGSAVGSATIVGLPFPASGSVANEGGGGIIVAYSGMAGMNAMPTMQVGAGSSVLELFLPGVSGGVIVTNAYFTDFAALAGNFWFIV